jgi:hypothetical protein
MSLRRSGLLLLRLALGMTALLFSAGLRFSLLWGRLEWMMPKQGTSGRGPGLVASFSYH